MKIACLFILFMAFSFSSAKDLICAVSIQLPKLKVQVSKNQTIYVSNFFSNDRIFCWNLKDMRLEFLSNVKLQIRIFRWNRLSLIVLGVNRLVSRLVNEIISHSIR